MRAEVSVYSYAQDTYNQGAKQERRCVDKPGTSANTKPDEQPLAEGDLPAGNHPLEIGARRGIGPLSPMGREVWHGRARPCVSCGQLVPRDAAVCEHCGQDLSPAMINKMRVHAGPWYVLEHIRPFPGVSLERIVRQIRRGLITETSIVRGPSTDHQWRFAAEVPGVCRYFGRCWNCHEQVSPSDTCCPHCSSYLSFERPRPVPEAPPVRAGGDIGAGHVGAGTTAGGVGRRRDRGSGGTAKLTSDKPDSGAASPPSDHLIELSAVVDRTDLPAHEPVWDEPVRIGGIRATWVVTAALVVFIVALMFFTQSRSRDVGGPGSTTPLPVQNLQEGLSPAGR